MPPSPTSPIPPADSPTPAPTPPVPASPVPAAAPAHVMSPVEAELETLIRARYPLIYVVSWEERRVEETLRDICQTAGARK